MWIDIFTENYNCILNYQNMTNTSVKKTNPNVHIFPRNEKTEVDWSVLGWSHREPNND